MNASLAEPGPSDSPLNCVSLTDFDFLNLNCQFYHKREEIPVCCFSPITVSFRFHYNNLGFDLKHFLNGFFVFCESPPSAARADSLGVGGSRGFPRGPTSPCRLHPWWINLACAGGCRERRLPVSQNWGEPICHPIKGHYRGVLKFSSMGGREPELCVSTETKSKQGLMFIHTFPTLSSAERRNYLQKKPKLTQNLFV